MPQSRALSTADFPREGHRYGRFSSGPTPVFRQIARLLEAQVILPVLLIAGESLSLHHSGEVSRAEIQTPATSARVEH